MYTAYRLPTRYMSVTVIQSIFSIGFCSIYYRQDYHTRTCETKHTYSIVSLQFQTYIALNGI